LMMMVMMMIMMRPFPCEIQKMSWKDGLARKKLAQNAADAPQVYALDPSTAGGKLTNHALSG